MRTFTKTTAIQHATVNIRCNSIHPGPVDTPMLANISEPGGGGKGIAGSVRV